MISWALGSGVVHSMEALKNVSAHAADKSLRGSLPVELESQSISALSSRNGAGFTTTGHPVYPRSPGMGCTLMPAAVRN